MKYRGGELRHNRTGDGWYEFGRVVDVDECTAQEAAEAIAERLDLTGWYDMGNGGWPERVWTEPIDPGALPPPYRGRRIWELEEKRETLASEVQP